MAKDNGNGTVTVVSGDTLSAIASKYYSTYGKSYSSVNAYMQYIAKINDIDNVNLIYVGQTIKLTESSSGSSGSSSGSSSGANKGSTTNVAVVTHGPALLANNDRTVYVAWSWGKNNVDHYEVKWYYSWGAGVAPYEEHTATQKYDTFTAPDYATHVTVYIKPIAKTYKDKNDNEVSYWTAGWSTKKTYYFSSNPPTDTPSAPDVTIENNTLTAEVNDVPAGINSVEFQVVKDNSNNSYAGGKETVASNYAKFTCDIVDGGSYKVRCRYINENGVSEWSGWSGNKGTKPAASSGISVCRAASENSVYLEWGAVADATSYDLEYTTDVTYFEGSDQTSTVSGIKTTKYTKTGLEAGEEYFFRVRAVNENGESAWSSAKSIILGTAPAAPTTWSSITTLITGETLTLYWVHNSEDGSPQDKAEIELVINGTAQTKTIDTSTEDEDERTMFYSIDTSQYGEGVTILWRVRTMGITGEYGDWSVQRTVKVYAPPEISFNILDNTSTEIDTLLSFPFNINGTSYPSTQTPVGYHITITSNSYYETVDNIGIRKIVNVGDEVYSNYLNSSSHSLDVWLSPGDLDLENNVTYTVKCIVSMNSGLTGESTRDFTVAWTDEIYSPNAEVAIDTDTVSASISPYCMDEEGNLIDGVKLSVYRREFDGSFTELITGLHNTNTTFVVDPHPALDYARYRIVAISESTGAVSYSDLAGIPVGWKTVILQWDEEWSSYERSEYPTEEPSWVGSILKLPYNIDVSDDYAPDVSLINYIGRAHPVTYYGTQLGHTSSWSMEIPKTDIDTLYALRRLSRWLGDVYVREPSGTGYWANVTVSLSQKHLATTIPVKLSITRVAGGI